jgi:hypothetical protein
MCRTGHQDIGEFNRALKCVVMRESRWKLGNSDSTKQGSRMGHALFFTIYRHILLQYNLKVIATLFGPSKLRRASLQTTFGQFRVDRLRHVVGLRICAACIAFIPFLRREVPPNMSANPYLTPQVYRMAVLFVLQSRVLDVRSLFHEQASRGWKDETSQ